MIFSKILNLTYFHITRPTKPNQLQLRLSKLAELLSQKSKQNKKSLPWNGRIYGYHSFYDKVRLYFKTEKVDQSLELSCCLHFWKSERTKAQKWIKWKRLRFLLSNQIIDFLFDFNLGETIRNHLPILKGKLHF